MSGGTRALIVSFVLFVLWGTINTGPFRYFANGCKNVYIWAFSHISGTPLFVGLIVSLFLCLSTIVLLALSAKKYSPYIAGVCALLSMLYYLFLAYRQKDYGVVSFAVAMGLAVALLIQIARAEKLGAWLADAYIFSLPVLLFYELVMTPLYVHFGIRATALKPFIIVTKDGLGTWIGNLFGLPMIIWGVFLFSMMMIPLLNLAHNRKKA